MTNGLKDEITADQNVPCGIKLQLNVPVEIGRQAGRQVDREMDDGKEIKECVCMWACVYMCKHSLILSTKSAQKEYHPRINEHACTQISVFNHYTSLKETNFVWTSS